MTPAETETTIVYDKEQQLARIFTAWLRDQRKLEKAGVRPVAGRGTPETGLFYEVPLARLFWKVRPVGQKKSTRGFAGRKPILEQGGPSVA